jgi:hypothetical protein
MMTQMLVDARLRQFIDADHTLPGVKATLLSLGQSMAKLLGAVPEGIRAKHGTEPVDDAGTLDEQVMAGGLGLKPSNFFFKFLAAMRALKWPKGLVVVHGLLP